MDRSASENPPTDARQRLAGVIVAVALPTLVALIARELTAGALEPALGVQVGWPAELPSWSAARAVVRAGVGGEMARLTPWQGLGLLGLTAFAALLRRSADRR
jgi:hypothetical protein